MRHRAALIPAIVTATTAILAVGAPANAVVQGVQVRITELPRTFSAGADPRTVTVVASTDSGAGCQKVRWSMLMQVQGIRFDQVKVERIENSADFPLQVQSDGDTARLTDAQFDPGTLCRGRTVTAQYRVSFADGVTDGLVRFQAEAFDARARLLERANGTSEVVGGQGQNSGGQDQNSGGQGQNSGGQGQQPTGQTDPTPDPDQSTASDGTGAGNSTDTEVNQSQDQGPATPEPSATSAIASVPVSKGSTPSLLGVGLIIGAILMFLGVGLLLRVRTRLRQQPDVETFAMTRAFDPAP